MNNSKGCQAVPSVGNSGHKYHRLKSDQCLCQGEGSARITGRKVSDLYSKVRFFPTFVQPVLPQASLSSAGAWKKSNSPKAAQISLHIPTQVFCAFCFFLLLCTAFHNPLTSASLRSHSPSPINLILDMNPVLQDVSRPMWGNWWKTWEAAEKQRKDICRSLAQKICLV